VIGPCAKQTVRATIVTADGRYRFDLLLRRGYQGVGDRSGDAPVLGLQLRKGLDGVRVADDAGNLPPAGRVRRLALRAGLGFHLGARRTQGDEAVLFLAELRRVGRTPHGAEAVGAGGPQVDGAEAAVLVDGQRFHGWTPVRTGLGCHVTSDTSTTVGRVAA
jgi:hypothetical protein